MPLSLSPRPCTERAPAVKFIIIDLGFGISFSGLHYIRCFERTYCLLGHYTKKMAEMTFQQIRHVFLETNLGLFCFRSSNLVDSFCSTQIFFLQLIWAYHSLQRLLSLDSWPWLFLWLWLKFRLLVFFGLRKVKSFEIIERMNFSMIHCF